MGSRTNEYKSKWKELTEIYGNLCFYCRKEIASCLDHVVPYTWDQDSGQNNLVPACLLCNGIAANRVFETIEEKRYYILTQRSKRANRIAICTGCLLPFAYRWHSPSLFLCAECFDLEYRTEYSQRTEWRRWIKQLWAAGIPAQAHRAVRKRMIFLKASENRDTILQTLVDEYAAYVDSDDVFAERLIRS